MFGMGLALRFERFVGPGSTVFSGLGGGNVRYGGMQRVGELRSRMHMYICMYCTVYGWMGRVCVCVCVHRGASLRGSGGEL